MEHKSADQLNPKQLEGELRLILRGFNKKCLDNEEMMDKVLPTEARGRTSG